MQTLTETPDFFHKYINLAKGLARRMWEPGDRLVGEGFDDFQQEAIWALYQASLSFKPDENGIFAAYAAKRIRWRLTDKLRRLYQGRSLHIFGFGGLPNPCSDDDPTFEHRTSILEQPFKEEPHNHEIHCMDDLIDELTTQQRKVIIGVYYQDKPAFKVGEEMGLKPPRISVIHKQSLNRLKELLMGK